MVNRLLLLSHKLNPGGRLYAIKGCAMEDDFLKAAILNWNDIEPGPATVPGEAESMPFPQAPSFNPSLILLALYVLAILVLIYLGMLCAPPR
jgi:hypothetical protein